MMSSSPLSWSLMSKLVDESFPRIPTDLTIHLVDEDILLVDDEGDWEEGFQVVREPIQVEAHRIVLALVSPVLRALLYSDQPPSSITLECSSGALAAVLDHSYGRQLEWARLTPTERDQVVSLGRQYQIVGLLEAVAVAEEDLLDGLFAVSLETSLFSEEKTTTTSPVNNSEYNNDNYSVVDVSLQKILTGKSDDVIVRVSELPSTAGSTTDSSVHQLDNSSSRKVSILLVEEDMNKEAAEDNSCTLDTDEDEDMAEAEEAMCENCNCIVCKDGEVIASTLEFGGRLGCQVAVANCVTSYWGNGYRAQRGEVTKIDSTDRVTVHWVDGSESQFNVHPTERPETDTVLCFHCC